MVEALHRGLSEAPASPPKAEPKRFGRCVLFDTLAHGGMATVHIGRMFGSAGFARTVAVKRLHSHLAENPQFVGMFLDEARLAARLVHPNIVSTLDVIADRNELLLVMEYIHGASLAQLLHAVKKGSEIVPPSIASAIVAGALHGLHAAHSAVDDRGQPLHIVHRDVSPQNIIVGVDGVARVLDFGVAKAVSNVQATLNGELKGKVAYMAPEQIRHEPIDRRCDIYAASVVLWEALTGRRLFDGDNDVTTMHQVLVSYAPPPSKHVPNLSENVDEVVLKGLHQEPSRRFATAREMALALEKALPPALPSEIGAWVERQSTHLLERRAQMVSAVEKATDSAVTPHAAPDPYAILPETLEEHPSLSAASAATSVRAHGKTRLLPWVATAVLVLILAGTLVRNGVSSAGSANASPPSGPVVAAPNPPPDPPPQVLAVPPAPSEPPVVAAPPPVATAKPPVGRPTGRPGPAPRPKPAGNCEASTVDAQGHTIFHPECLRAGD